MHLPLDGVVSMDLRTIETTPFETHLAASVGGHICVFFPGGAELDLAGVDIRFLLLSPWSHF